MPIDIIHPMAINISVMILAGTATYVFLEAAHALCMWIQRKTRKDNKRP